MDYGQYKCNYLAECEKDGPNVSTTIQIPSGALSEPFLTQIKRLGLTFVGRPLTLEFIQDGKRIVIFENVVLYTDADSPTERVFALPIIELLGIVVPQSPVANMDHPQMYFFQVSGDKGYNIPKRYMDYIGQHGGLDIFGLPITENHVIADGVFRQCFTNICLEFHSALSNDLQLRPTAAGKTFQQKFYPEKGTSIDGRSTGYDLKVTKSHYLVGEQTTQEINVSVTHDQIPESLIQPEMFLKLPDGRENVFVFPPTDNWGNTILEIPYIPAPNSTMVPYRVCLVAAETICFEDHYVIWNSP